MNPSVTIKSARDATRLTFSDAAGESFVAALKNPHFRGHLVVSTYHSGPPTLLFDEMARQWSGWNGTKKWEALEGELQITASADHTGHITLGVIMHDCCNPDGWRLQATLQLEAGQLHEWARAIRKVFNDVSAS